MRSINLPELAVGAVIYSLLIILVLLAMKCMQPMACDVGLGIIPAMLIGYPMLAVYKSLHPLLGAYSGLVATLLASSVMLLFTGIIAKSSDNVRRTTIILLILLIFLSAV